MKNSIYFLAVTALVLAAACKKDKKEDSVKPVPYADIEFGGANGFSFSRIFNPQNEVSADTLRKFEYLMVNVSEHNLESFYGYTTDSGVIAILVKTNSDDEYFNSETLATGRSSWTSSAFGSREFGGQLNLPYKFSNTAVKGNDTLEISDAGDLVRIHYQSLYTGMQAADSLILKP